MKFKLFAVLSLCMLMFISSCGVYSFSGASISPEIKTIGISLFQNRASIVQPSLSQNFTDKLKEKFVSQTSLRLTGADADLQLEGSITDYHTSPVAIQGTQTAALNRLSVTVQVKFTNTKDPKMDFDSPFTRYADYSSARNLTDVELSLIDEINRQLVDDIFNRAVSNW